MDNAVILISLIIIVVVIAVGVFFTRRNRKGNPNVQIKNQAENYLEKGQKP